MLTFGLVCAPSATSIEKNMQTLKKYAAQAKERSCTALCFPECFLTGYAPKESAKSAISKDSSYVNVISRLAAELQLDLLTGFMESDSNSDIQVNFTERKLNPVIQINFTKPEQRRKRCYITHGVFLTDGTTHFYRKTHLGTREKEYFAAGNSLDVFTLSCGVKIGIQLCAETHFNDITQTLSLRGAQLIFAPHAVPGKAGSRKSVWEKYIPARSYDNRVYMACCNQWDGEKFEGGALVTNPAGETIASSYEKYEQLLTFSIEESNVLPAEQLPQRGKYYFPEKRRPELYDYSVLY